jgi:hypothetical protein
MNADSHFKILAIGFLEGYRRAQTWKEPRRMPPHANHGPLFRQRLRISWRAAAIVPCHSVRGLYRKGCEAATGVRTNSPVLCYLALFTYIKENLYAARFTRIRVIPTQWRTPGAGPENWWGIAGRNNERDEEALLTCRRH